MNSSWIKKYSKLLKLIYYIIIILLIIAVLEYAASKLITGQNVKSFLANNYYLTQPWGKELKKEQSSFTSLKAKYLPYAVYGHRQFSGNLVNVDENGLRRTINITDKDKKRKIIYMFGGSTTFCLEVKDELTIASILSKLLNEHSKDYSYEVVNFGTSGYNSSTEVMRLYLEARNDFTKYGKPSHVIFYDGVNDVQNGIYDELPGSHFGYRNIELRFNDVTKFVIEGLFRRLYSESSLLQLIFNNVKNIPITELYSSFERHKNYDELSIQQSNIYKNNLLFAKAILAQKNIKTTFFLQPTIYSTQVKNPFDVQLKNIVKTSLSDNYNAFQKGYSQFKNIQNSKNITLLDMSNILDNKTEKQLFIDEVHTTHYANEIIAYEIYKRIKTDVE